MLLYKPLEYMDIHEKGFAYENEKGLLMHLMFLFACPQGINLVLRNLSNAAVSKRGDRI